MIIRICFRGRRDDRAAGRAATVAGTRPGTPAPVSEVHRKIDAPPEPLVSIRQPGCGCQRERWMRDLGQTADQHRVLRVARSERLRSGVDWSGSLRDRYRCSPVGGARASCQVGHLTERCVTEVRGRSRESPRVYPQGKSPISSPHEKRLGPLRDLPRE